MSIKYKCLIADDNMLDRDVVEMNLSKIDNVTIEAVCSNGLEASTILIEKEIDIVFTDIDMPDMNGMELLQSLKQPPVFIFISSYGEYAAESYNMDVIDFIVKPVKLPRLVKAVNKAIEYIELKKKLGNAEKNDKVILLNDEGLNDGGIKDHFFIKENYDYIKVENKEVVYIESMGNFSRLYTTENKKYITLVGLKNVEAQLPTEDFIRVHKQFIININHLISLSNNNEIILKGNVIIPLSTVYKSAFMEIINKKMLLR